MEIFVNNINKSFGDKQVLHNVTLRAKSGEALGLLGRNGAGKTTTIRIIMDVFRSDSGEVLCDNVKVSRDNLRMGYLPEERGLYPKKDILSQLVYLAELKGVSRQKAKENTLFYLDKLGMTEYTNKKLETLSKGNQQKIQLISVLVGDPDVIILDEPFSGLDPVNSVMLKNIVKDEIAKGKVVILSSHQMNYIEEFCDHIAIMKDGRIVLDGDLDSIKKSYDRTTIVVGAADLEAIRKNIPWSSRIVEDELYIKLGAESEKNNLMESIAKLGMDIDYIKVYEPSLNDIFIEYTGDEHETV